MPVPARPRLRSAGTLVVALAGTALACEPRAEPPDEGPRLLELDSATLPLPDSVDLMVVVLDRSLAADIEPAALEVRAGDIVRFEARDAAAHAIVFEGNGLGDEARQFLEVTGQLRSPPLVGVGNAWVVSFGNAPPGEYPFHCATHGAAGRISVRAR